MYRIGMSIPSTAAQISKMLPIVKKVTACDLRDVEDERSLENV
jgi:hypothetical protein